MPVSYSIFEDRSLLLVRVTGILRFEEIVGAHMRILSQLEGWTGLVQIADLTAADQILMSPSQVRDISERVSAVLSRLKLRASGVIIAPDDHAFALARVYCAQSDYGGRETMAAVRNVTAAAVALDMPSEDLGAILAAGTDERRWIPIHAA